MQRMLDKSHKRKNCMSLCVLNLPQSAPLLQAGMSGLDGRRPNQTHRPGLKSVACEVI